MIIVEENLVPYPFYSQEDSNEKEQNHILKLTESLKVNIDMRLEILYLKVI